MQLQYYISDVDKRMEIYIMGIIFVALVLVIAKKNGLNKKNCPCRKPCKI